MEAFSFQTTNSQILFKSQFELAASSDGVRENPFIIPVIVSVFSVMILVLHKVMELKAFWSLWSRFQHGSTYSRSDEQANVTYATQLRANIVSQGGTRIFLYNLARFLTCLVFIGLAVTAVTLERNAQTMMALLISAYAAILGLLSLVTGHRWNHLISLHLTMVLVSLLCVFIYRDIWPLAKIGGTPQDASEGGVLWAKITVLAIASVVIPLIMPRNHIPLDKHAPAPPAPEQTCSIFSLLIWSLLDPVIISAYKNGRITHDSLPPLADYDDARHLVEKSFPLLDPMSGKRHHMFWGLAILYRADFFLIAIMMALEVLTALASPFGINKLLQYIETGGEEAEVKPWVWILWLLLAPILGSIAIQWQHFLATRVVVHTEAIITQLVFNHALRIRMKAGTSAQLNSNATDADNLNSDRLDAGISGNVPVPDHTVEGAGDVFDEPQVMGGESEVTDIKAEASTKAPKVSDNIVGKINNLCTSDLKNIVGARDFLLLFFKFPLQLALSVWLLYSILGWSALVGLVIMLALFPIPGAVAKMMQSVQVTAMQKTDARVQTVTEILNVLRMIKLFGWEEKINEKIAEKREDELRYIWKQRILEVCTTNINMIIPVLTTIATYAIYTLVMEQDLTASKVFASISVFDMLRDQFHIVFGLLPNLVQGKVSLDRVDNFLHQTELLDRFSDPPVNVTSPNSQDPQIDIGIRNVTFSWSADASAVQSKPFSLRVQGELSFKRNAINVITGRSGSGKTSLLMALLGEMHSFPSGAYSAVCLPRENGVAYAAQESWVLNASIKENILFGSTYDENRYKDVLCQCGLSRDLELFEAGDRTEVGEKGLTLSGGQKARITLARAVYSPAQILLLDDIFAALDVHTAKHIVEECFMGKLVQGRTIILVTHNIPLVAPLANFVVSLGANGTILKQGSVLDVLKLDDRQTGPRKNLERIDEGGTNLQSEGGKLIMPEEIEDGHVGWKAFKVFLNNLGGQRPVFFWIIFVGSMFSIYSLNTAQTWWLGHWTSKYGQGPSSTVLASYYLSVYAILVALAVVISSIGVLNFMLGSLRASRNIHSALVESILGTTLRWLDETPSSRIITRCTQDMRAVDDDIAHDFAVVTELSLSMLIKLAAVILFTPIFIFPSICITVLGAGVGHVYIKAQLPVKREMSISKSPVLGHFGAAIAGLVSIRAYGAQSAFKNESLIRINRYTRAARTYYNLNRWIRFRIDSLGSIFTATLAIYLVYYGNAATPASETGFSLNMAVGFAYTLLWWVGYVNMLEVKGNSLERIQEYMSVEKETSTLGKTIEPPAYWPASGDVSVEGLSARYSYDGPWVLRDISFHVKPGERIGIVGRTGSGKSSLVLALLRGLLTEGSVRYDNILTGSISVKKLRSSITVIPQIPELLKGTVRENLDPFNEHDDATLNNSLRAAGLFSLQSKMSEGKITLDSAVAGGGNNLSVGQRQILALARAIVRNNKLLILDEATSAIDYKTDTIIQRSLRTELGRDVTLIIVAHRLQTIMDANKIMVLDAGQIAEFGSPAELLKNPAGALSALVKESDDRELLLSLVKK